MRTKLYIDFWNFQLDWNRVTGKTSQGDPIRVPWEKLPHTILSHLSEKHGSDLRYDGARVYASVDPSGDQKLRRFLHTMQSFPGYSVVVKERKASRKPVRCNACRSEIATCPECQQQLKRSVEKGIDVAIVTDMIQMAHDNIYEVAVLGSNDADLCPCVSFIQDRIGKRIYHLWYQDVGVNLRNVCWDHISMHDLFDDLGIPPQEP